MSDGEMKGDWEKGSGDDCENGQESRKEIVVSFGS